MSRYTGFVQTIGLVLSSCLLSACQPEAQLSSKAQFSAPDRILQARAVDRSQLRPKVTLSDNRTITMTETGDNTWSGTINVLPNSNYFIFVDWIETLPGGDLLLASWSGNVPVDADGTQLNLSENNYDYSADADGDSVPNLEEREDDTDPFDPDDNRDTDGDNSDEGSSDSDTTSNGTGTTTDGSSDSSSDGDTTSESTGTTTDGSTAQSTSDGESTSESTGTVTGGTTEGDSTTEGDTTTTDDTGSVTGNATSEGTTDNDNSTEGTTAGTTSQGTSDGDTTTDGITAGTTTSQGTSDGDTTTEGTTAGTTSQGTTDADGDSTSSGVSDTGVTDVGTTSEGTSTSTDDGDETAGTTDAGTTDDGSTTAGDGGTTQTRASVLIPRILPSEAPVIDGLGVTVNNQQELTGEWLNAVQVDTAGIGLWIDRLMIDNISGPVDSGVDGEKFRRWAAMHDGINLYVVVMSDDVGKRYSDSDQIWYDDSLELFIDGNHSKLSVWGDEDDYHYLIALQEQDSVVATTEFSDRVQSRSFATSGPLDLIVSTGPGKGPRGIRIAKWEQDVYELSIPIAVAGITIGKTFGFELQINDDDDEEARDTKWGWAHPSRMNDINADESYLNPSVMGTASLQE